MTQIRPKQKIRPNFGLRQVLNRLRLPGSGWAQGCAAQAQAQRLSGREVNALNLRRDAEPGSVTCRGLGVSRHFKTSQDMENSSEFSQIWLPLQHPHQSS